MVKLSVGSDGGDFVEIQAADDVRVLCSLVEDLDAREEDGKSFEASLAFHFLIVDPENEQEGETFKKFCNKPKGAKMHPNSTLFKLLNKMTPGGIDEDDDVDTDDYEGKYYLVDFEKVPRKIENPPGSKNWVTRKGDDGKTMYKTDIGRIKPEVAKKKKPKAAPAQEEMDWEDDEE